MEDSKESDQIRVAKISSSQIILTTLITAVASIFVTLISTGYFSPKDDSRNVKEKMINQKRNSNKLKYPFFRTKNGDTLNLSNISNIGVNIKSITSNMDWSAMANVGYLNSKIRDKHRISPGIQDDIIKYSKTTERAKYFIKRFASQRALMDFWVFTNHAYEIAYFNKKELPNPQTVGSLNHHWFLIFDIEDEQLNLNQEIQYRATRWNAFQLKNQNYYGRLIIGNESETNLNIELPRDKSIESIRLTEQKLGRENKEVSFNSDVVDTTISKNRVSWKILNPKDAYLYRLYINWKNN